MPTRVFIFCIIVSLLAPLRAQNGLQRITPTTVRMPIVPNAVTEYSLEREAFPGLSFDSPVAIVSPPGESNRLFIVERAGRIVLIPDLNSPSREVFLDISDRVNSNYTELENGAEGLSCVAFHPNYAENGYFYVVYTWPSPEGNMNRLSRFTRSPANSGDPDSEQVMIEQPDAGYGHNFNDVKFGPDGYLYVAAGDEGDGKGPGDEYGNSQRIDKNFFSAIMRIDVDQRPSSLPPNPHPSFKGGYAIPADNPFVGATEFNGMPVQPDKVRTEFWAVGFRNPWRMFFDHDGTLYAGDVGRHAREEINLVVRGGNYGWAFREGATVSSALGDPPAGVTLIPPLLEYPHGEGQFEGKCVIGGVVYRGLRLPGLHGAYIFGDYMYGNIWALRHHGSEVTEWSRIAGLYDVAAFGIDPRNGDVLVCKDKINGPGGDGIFRLEARSGSGESPIPVTLAGTGLFSDLRDLIPAPGLVNFSVNAPFWSDGAVKNRWFGLLDPASKIQFHAETNWVFPTGAIWVKHFELELEKDNPASRRRIETRVIVKNDSNDGVYGVTYRWGDSMDDATLVGPDGAEDVFVVRDGSQTRLQTWRYPSRNACIACHTSSGGYALGFNTPQLNRNAHPALAQTNQIIAFRDAGYLEGAVENVHSLRRLTDLGETSWSRESRARSYLAANCANCHNPAGVERARWDGNIFTALSDTKMIDGDLLDSFGDPENRVIKPGDPDRSVLYLRMKELGPGHMPPLGSTVVHQEAVELIHDWIREDLHGYHTFEDWIAGYAVSADGRADDPDGDGASNYLEYLLGTNPADHSDGFAISIRQVEGRGVIQFPRRANRGFEVVTSSSLSNGWTSVNSPSNVPFFAATNQTATVDFPIDPDQDQFFRVRVFEP